MDFLALGIILVLGAIVGGLIAQQIAAKKDVKYWREVVYRRDDLLDAQCRYSLSLEKALVKIRNLRMMSDYTCASHEGNCTIVKDVEVVVNAALGDKS